VKAAVTSQKLNRAVAWNARWSVVFVWINPNALVLLMFRIGAIGLG